MALLALLYHYVVPDTLKTQGIWQALALQPGLHVVLGIAAALSSWLNLLLLYRWLHKAKVYKRQPGWAKYGAQLLLACTTMVTVLLVLQRSLPTAFELTLLGRIGSLLLLVISAISSYALALWVLGLRWHQLKGIQPGANK